MKKFLVAAVLLGAFIGCDSQPKAEPPIARVVDCPLCDRDAALQAIYSSSAMYRCEKHHKTSIDRKTGRVSECEASIEVSPVIPNPKPAKPIGSNGKLIGSQPE